MAYPSLPRVEWAPDGTRLLACRGGAITIHALDGSVQRVAAPDGFLDARWRKDGTILGLDTYGVARSFTMHGALYSDEPPVHSTRYSAGALSADCSTFVVITGGRVRARAYQGMWWELALDSYGITADGGYHSAALSTDGRAIAIGYETRTWQERTAEIHFGRGWIVLDLRTPQRTARQENRPPRVVDRAWSSVPVVEAPVLFEFAGSVRARRIAIATPGKVPSYGALRLGGGQPARTHDGGAAAVALDARGVIAAYAYPPGRVRVDYLSPEARGPANIEILDTLWIEPDRPPVALAFDGEGHHLACLAADGAVEIVPVP